MLDSSELVLVLWRVSSGASSINSWPYALRLVELALDCDQLSL